MAVSNGHCLKTSAKVLITNYGKVAACDIFAIGTTHLLLNFRGGFHKNAMWPSEMKETHTACIFKDFAELDKGIIVVERANFKGELVE